MAGAETAMLKFKKIGEGRIQAFRFHANAEPGEKNKVIGSFPDNVRTIPRFIMEKLDEKDLRELVAKTPLAAWLMPSLSGPASGGPGRPAAMAKRQQPRR
jgi:hypothetical protein